MIRILIITLCLMSLITIQSTNTNTVAKEIECSECSCESNCECTGCTCKGDVCECDDCDCDDCDCTCGN
ncbi:MAG: hypothetical protein AB7V50_09860 [Vampirovibrionia bacterium]